MIHTLTSRLLSISMIVLAVLTVGCEGAGAPLGEADEVPVNPDVIGSWYASGEEEGDAGLWLRVWAFNDSEYYVEWEGEEEDDDLARLRVFASDLGTYLFANVQCINCDEDDRKEWFFFQYEFESPDVLLIRGIEDEHYSDAMSQMSDSRDVRRYVERHMGDTGFFSEDVLRMTQYVAEEATD